MKHKYELLTAFVCFCCILMVCLAISVRAEFNKREAASKSTSTARVVAIGDELADDLRVLIREAVEKALKEYYGWDDPKVIIHGTNEVIEEADKVIEINEDDAVMLAKLMWGEYRDTSNYPQCASVCWCVLNRLDAGGFGETVEEVVTAPYQFSGYSVSNPVNEELLEIARDVLREYAKEDGSERTLDRRFLWFSGNGKVNIYRTAYQGGCTYIP